MDREEGEINYSRGDRRANEQDAQIERKKKNRFSGKSIYERREARRRKREEKNSSRSSSRDRSHSRHSSRHHHSRRSRSRSNSHSRSRSTRQNDTSKEAGEVLANAPTEGNQTPSNPVEGVPPIPEAEDPNNVHKQCERAVIEATRRAGELLKKRGLLPDTAPSQSEEKKNANETKVEEKVEESYELPKTLQEKIEKDTKTGPLSWYKPATAASVTSLLEKKEN